MYMYQRYLVRLKQNGSDDGKGLQTIFFVSVVQAPVGLSIS